MVEATQHVWWKLHRGRQRPLKAFRMRGVGVGEMQEFYFDSAYLRFQKERLGELDVEQVFRDRQRRIDGNKRVRQEHKTYADKLRLHADSHSWTKPKNSVLKENAAKHKERKDATGRMAASRSQRAAASAEAEEDVDVFNATVPINWGSQASQQPASQPPTYTAPRLWATHLMPAGLRPERSASPAVAEHDEVIEDDEDDAKRDYDLLASDFCDRVHALWLSEAHDATNNIRISESTTWEFEGIVSPDNWAFIGHLLAKNIAHATLEKTRFLFVTGKSERKRCFRTLMCKVSTGLGKRKTDASLATADYKTSLSALEKSTSECANDLWSGAKRRTATKRTVGCQVQLRLSYNVQGIWQCKIGKHLNHDHQPTASAAPIVVPAATAQAVTALHVTAGLSVTQAARVCDAQCSSFIPRSALRSLFRNCAVDQTWGQGGQAGLLLELMLDSKIDLCAQFQKTNGNRIEALVTVARLNGTWTVVEGGLLHARKEYAGMVLVLKRLETLHRRNPSPQLADRICAARTVRNARLAPTPDIAPGMDCTGDYFEVSQTSPAALIELNAVLLSALGHLGNTKLRMTHACYCTEEDRKQAMMHPNKIMFDTTCKTNAAKKHFGYVSGNTTNHNWFKWSDFFLVPILTISAQFCYN